MKKKSIIFLITLALFIITIPVTITSGQTPSSLLLDNIQVSSNGAHVTSNIALQNGVSYQIVVSGTYFTVKGDLTQNNQQDAMYGTHDKWTTHDSTSDGLYFDRWSIGSKQWGAYSSDHNYQCSLIGNGSKVSFWVYSESYNGNSGSLTVQILGSPVAPPSSTPTPTPTTTSPTPTMSVTQTPSITTPASTSPSPDSSPTPTNSHNTSPTSSPTNSPIVTTSPNQNSGSLFEGPVTVVIALIVSVIVVALFILFLSKRKKNQS